METISTTLLEPIRAKYDLPALAATVIVDGTILPAVAVGAVSYTHLTLPTTPYV